MASAEDEIGLSVDLTPKLHVKKQRDQRLSVWLSVGKWMFGFVLSLSVLASVTASKISLISIGTFYYSERSPCTNKSDISHSKETTFIMMVLILMIPQFMSLLRACWNSLCSDVHPWPTNAGIFWTVVAALLEVFGLSFFIIVVVLKTTLSAAHCVVIMNSVFLFPILSQFSRLKSLNQDKKISCALLVASMVLELVGIVLLSYDVISNNKPYINLQESIGIPVSLLLVSFAWCNKMQRLQFEPRMNTVLSYSDAFEKSTRSIEDSLPQDCPDDAEYEEKDTARDKSTIISCIVKLLVTPFVAALFCYLFKVADLRSLDNGFLMLTHHHPAFPFFMTQIFTSFFGSIFGFLACAMCMQRLALFLPMFLASPLSLLLVSVPKLCCTTTVPLSCIDLADKMLLPIAICLWMAQVLSTGIYLFKEQTFIMAKESSLFWLPVYNGAFMEQNLLLNRKNQITDETQMNQPEIAKKTCVYICTTMYHENESEMEQLLQSLHDIDTARKASRRPFESHIFFDGAVKEDVLNDFVLQLISLVPETLGVTIKEGMKLKTPYGMQLRWRLPGGMPFHIHLKDNTKVKNKKRWSQAMYMSYVLDYKEGTMETDDDNTYILATDADVRFTHESVEALLDLMMRDHKVGAVCGRTHPLGSGPVVWYQVFDYAIGHWFQKVANHVLGSVLCSPGCFSVYRARAIRDVLPIYASSVNTSIDFLTKDMGEDRWMCTLMVQSGWRLEYCAASEDSTFCPDTFDEFFNQRRRWIPSTLINLIQLISEWKVTVENNDKISIFFILYQALLVVSTLISPATVILVITGALKFSKLPGSENDVAVLIILCLITFGFAFICLYTKQKFQLKVAKLLTIMFSLLMAAVTVGMAAQIAIDLTKRGECPDIEVHSEVVGSNLTTTRTMPTVSPSPTTLLPIECRDGLPADLSSLYLAGLVGIFFAAALVHPTEAFCLVHGIWYLFCLPSGYLLLIIYSLANITDRSWGTRETKEKKVSDDVPWYKELLEKLKFACFCCRSQEPQSTSGQEIISNEFTQMAEDMNTDDEKVDDIKPNNDDETAPDDNEVSSTRQPVFPLPEPKKSILKTTKLRRAKSEDIEQVEPQSWRSPGERKKSVRLSKPVFNTDLPIEDWLPAELKTLYLKNFCDNGYDNISFVINMTDKDLRSIGIQKRGHRSQILYRIKQIPHVPPNTDVPENVEEWLSSLGLEIYWNQFKANGCTDPRALEELKSLDSDTLRKTICEELNIVKEGHIKKLIYAIKKMQNPTQAQRKIRQAREQVNKISLLDIQSDNQDEGKEARFWDKLRTRCLLPESAVFGSVGELKAKLEDLRDSFLTVFAVANVMWIIIIITLDKQDELKIKGTNAIGLAFLFVYGLVIVIQFLAMMWHRMSTLCHMLARAPWKRGPKKLLWAFNNKNLVPEPDPKVLEEIRKIRKERQTKRQAKTVRIRSKSVDEVRLNPIVEEGALKHDPVSHSLTGHNIK